MLTDTDLKRCENSKGAFTQRVVMLLGEDILIKGWHKRLRGKVVSRAKYNEACGIAALPKLKHVPYGDAPGQTALFT